MLTPKQIRRLQEELATAKNPLFFYDGDGDGLASFLLLYRLHREGSGYALNTSSVVDMRFMPKVLERDPDKIFILDIPDVSQDFIDAVNRPIFWLDHHPPQSRNNVYYCNPRLADETAYIPTSYMAWQVSQKQEDIWLATAGCLADWHMPDFIDQFIAQYPEYLAKRENLPTAVFKRKVGLLVKLLFFLQKGPSGKAYKSKNVLTRITSPDEIFQQQTAQGKFLFKHFSEVNKKYEELIAEAKQHRTRSRLLLFIYNDQKWSFTTNIANELIAFYPQKIVIVARSRGDKMKCSLRGKNVLAILQQALIGINGRGGGHPEACGAVIERDDWRQFIGNLKEAIRRVK